MPVILTKNCPAPVTDVAGAIAARLARGAVHSFCSIVPTKRKLREAQREMLRLMPGGVGPAPHLFTLETLALRLFALLCPPRIVAGGATQAVLLHEAVRSVKEQLAYFRLRGQSETLPPGTFQKIFNVINELKERGVYLPVLHEEVAAAGSHERPKLEDVLRIAEAYERMLGDRYTDAAGALRSVNLAWDPVTGPEAVLRHLGPIDALFVSGFDEFSDPELTMLANLSGMEGVGTVVAFDYHPANEDVFGHLRENYEKFLAMGFTLGRTAAPAAGASPFQEHIARHLFHHHVTNAAPLDCRSTVTLVDAADREDEVRLIAATIKRIVRDKPGQELSRMCVAMYRPQLYADLFREEFRACGIPANITDRFHLDTSPLVVAVMSLLAVAEHGFRLVDVMRALASPYLDFTSRGVAVDASNLYAVAGLLKITGGRGIWEARIEQRRAQIAADAARCDDEHESTELRRLDEALARAHRDIGFVAHLLEPLEGALTPASFTAAVERLLGELSVVRRLAEARDAVDAEQFEKDIRAYQKFMAFLDEFLHLLAIEGRRETPHTLRFYTERLRQALAQVRYNIRQRHGYGVYVTSLDETRGLSFDVMIVAGLVDGEFPPTYAPEFFYAPARREQKERAHLREHRYLFYQAITNFRDHLYLTYPRSENERELVPSSFLESMPHVLLLDDRRGDDAWRRACYCPDDVLRYLGEHLPEEPAFRAFARLLPEETVGQMVHAAAVERSRTEAAGGPYNGMLLAAGADAGLGDEGRAALEQLRQKTYSVTQLETYGKCPFRYFAERILRLASPQEVEERLSPVERGGMLHDMLFEFYISRRRRGLPPLAGASQEEFNAAVAELLAVARRKLGDLHIPDALWAVEQEEVLGSASRKGILEQFLDQERSSTAQTRPAYFELAFGPRTGDRRGCDPDLVHEHALEVDGVRLRGRVDRVDLAGPVFSVVDYKTGYGAAKMDDLERGMSLQIPVYLHAVERVLRETAGTSASGVAGIYYRLRDPVGREIGIASRSHAGRVFDAGAANRQVVPDDEALQGVIRKAIGYVRDYVAAIAAGVFVVEPKDPRTVCEHCDYITVCRIRTRTSAARTDRNAEEP